MVQQAGRIRLFFIVFCHEPIMNSSGLLNVVLKNFNVCLLRNILVMKSWLFFFFFFFFFFHFSLFC